MRDTRGFGAGHGTPAATCVDLRASDALKRAHPLVAHAMAAGPPFHIPLTAQAPPGRVRVLQPRGNDGYSLLATRFSGTNCGLKLVASSSASAASCGEAPGGSEVAR